MGFYAFGFYVTSLFLSQRGKKWLTAVTFQAYLVSFQVQAVKKKHVILFQVNKKTFS